MFNCILQLFAIGAERASLEAEAIELEELLGSLIKALNAAGRPKRQSHRAREGCNPFMTDGAELEFCLRVLRSRSIALTGDGLLALRKGAMDLEPSAPRSRRGCERNCELKALASAGPRLRALQ